jgi:pimeloyl-ACP methyl ester carboxylesterase/DNA-binding winged helix-turn-helix (wHTH) protein
MTVELVEFGPYRLDPAAGDLSLAGQRIPLTPKALAVLQHLVSRPGRLVSKQELLEAVWPGVFVGDASLKVCVREIRKALGDDPRQPRFIETAHRRGYRFIGPVAAAAPAGEAPPAPVVRYARSDSVNIAYQVVGSGPIDLVFVMGWVSHLEYFWREPSFARFLSRLASMSRLILFDKRGTGLSDPVPVRELPSLEQRMDDVRAVMEAAGSRRAVLLGVSEGGPLCSLFAATYPEKTEALIMIGSYARRLRDVDYPWGPTREERDAFLVDLVKAWGGPVGIDERAPSRADDPQFREWWASYLRMGASPGAAAALTRMNAEIDVRHVLPTIRVPTLVLHRSDDRCLLLAEGQYLAERIPGARFVELAGADHLPFVGDQDAVLEQIQAFLAERRPREASASVLATVLSVLADDSPPGGALGELEAGFDRELEWFRGRRLGRSSGTLGAVFDGPARAIRCGCRVAELGDRLGLRLRAGLHVGECDVREGTVGGPVVSIATSIALAARPREVLTSRTVVDLVAGAGLSFTERGRQRVPDLPDLRLFAVSR